MIRDIEFYSENAKWMKKGECTDPSIDPEWWFPVNQHRKDPQTELAMKICSECKVRIECISYALEHWPVEGIWGGLKEKQLKQLHKKRGK